MTGSVHPWRIFKDCQLARMSDGHYCLLRSLGHVKGGNGMQHREVVIDFSRRGMIIPVADIERRYLIGCPITIKSTIPYHTDERQRRAPQQSDEPTSATGQQATLSVSPASSAPPLTADIVGNPTPQLPSNSCSTWGRQVYHASMLSLDHRWRGKITTLGPTIFYRLPGDRAWWLRE